MSDNSIQYSAAKLEGFKTILEAEYKITKEELDRFKEDAAAQKEHLANASVDFNQNSKHFQAQAKNKVLIDRLENKFSELKSALSRIENKTYGVCDRTGQLIREERLKAKPTARIDILKN